MQIARAIFLDRDGVLNVPVIRDGKPFPPRSLREFVVADDAAASLARLKSFGFLLIVVTNQPDVRRGICSRDDVEQMHHLLLDQVSFDDLFVCYHDDQDHCPCRKPAPGLLLEAAGKYGIDLTSSYLVGDRWRDIDAGAATGCKTVLIDYRYNERRSESIPDAVVTTLSAAAGWILDQEAKSR